jgi:SLT domain-containing protein
MEQIAGSLESIANAINTVSNAYQKALPVLRFIQNPFNLNIPEAGFTPRPKARAAGGSVVSGQPYRVGEFGPEMFVPSGSGSIRPDSGGQGVTIIMNGVIDGESARRSIERLLQDSSRRTGAVNLVGATL